MAREEPHTPLPIKLGPCSNGETLPPRPGPVALEAVRRTRALVGDRARRIGLSRREFLLSAAGSATMLAVVAACARERGERAGSGPTGTYVTTTEAGHDEEAARAAVGGDEFVFDVQGHLLEFPPGPDPEGVPNFPQSSCAAARPADCYDTQHFLDLVLDQSDTDVVVLSAVPFGGNLLTPDVMAAAIDLAAEMGCDDRVLMQGESNPTVGSFEAVQESMADLVDRFPVAAWKVYTHAGGPGWFFDDHDPSAPAVGHRFLDEAVALGVPVVAVHKGFASDDPFSSPVDIGPAAVAHPENSIVVYHSGFEPDHVEGPYDADDPVGVDRLVASLESAGVGPGQNVYAELGSTWRTVMGDPDQAAHVLGKLLRAVGEDNVVWGTDSIWYGSPQDQIEAFRAFEITEEAQERFGYPALTDDLKAKVLGLNSARLYGIDPVARTCEVSADEQAAHRQATGVKNGVYGPTTDRGARALMDAPELWEGP